MLRLMEEKERREGEPTTADEYNKPDLTKYGPAYSAALSNSIDKLDIPGSLNHPKERVNNEQGEAKKGTT